MRTRLYKNNVTRPGLVYDKDVKRFLSINYKELVNLIHYLCEAMGKVEYEEDFRAWYFLKYLSGFNNYVPSKGDISKFFYTSFYFGLGRYMSLMEVSERQVPVGKGLDRSIDVREEYDSSHEVYLLERALRVRGVEDFELKVYHLLLKGYSKLEIADKLHLSISQVIRVVGLFKTVYEKIQVSMGMVRVRGDICVG